MPLCSNGLNVLIARTGSTGLITAHARARRTTLITKHARARRTTLITKHARARRTILITTHARTRTAYSIPHRVRALRKRTPEGRELQHLIFAMRRHLSKRCLVLKLRNERGSITRLMSGRGANLRAKLTSAPLLSLEAGTSTCGGYQKVTQLHWIGCLVLGLEMPALTSPNRGPTQVLVVAVTSTRKTLKDVGRTLDACGLGATRPKHAAVEIVILQGKVPLAERSWPTSLNQHSKQRPQPTPNRVLKGDESPTIECKERTSTACSYTWFAAFTCSCSAGRRPALPKRLSASRRGRGAFGNGLSRALEQVPQGSPK